jgi:GDP-mannose 6-dehydrogenase
MKVAVFGLGYVGSVSAANFAADGHAVIGVDVNPEKVAAVNAGRSPIVEPGLGDLLQQGVESRRPICRWCASARQAGRTAASI